VRSSIPIYVPALFEKTVTLAADAADGLLGHPVWSLKWIQEQSARLDKLLGAKGRKRADFQREPVELYRDCEGSKASDR
jgi:hypothetical protein